MKYTLYILLCFLVSFTACKNKNNKILPKVDKKEVNEIKEHLNVKIFRYEEALFAMNQNNIGYELNNLKKDYAFFLGDNPATKENIEQIKSFINYTVHQDLYKAVKKQYPDLSFLENDFSNAFSLIKYYFPDKKIPTVYTAILGLNYEMPVIYVDSVVVIALDMYLGPNYYYYKRLGPQVPQFIIRRFSKEYILRDCMKEMAFNYMQFNRNTNSLLEEMIIEGKRWMFTEIALPDLPDTIISGYPLKKLQWAQQYESEVWTFLIQKNYLYSNDNSLLIKFVYDAPFTAYFGNSSPGQIGAWIGWQICRAWVKNNPDKKISDLMNEKDAQKILKESKYKPKNTK